MENLSFNKPKKNTKIAVAMSGGVDSSVTAAMLKKSGYDVFGLTMRLYSQSDRVNENKTCCAGKDIEDAVNTAKQYNFAHYILDLQESFFNNVIDDFIETYKNGETPIPCIRCNQTVKFTDMLKFAKKMNADALVTGHYARRIGGLKNAKLYKALDNKRDQSYFLFSTTQDQLDYLRFPLGEYTKTEVRKIAKKLSLSVTDKQDSQDICFVTSGSYRDMISKLKPDSFISGDILNLNGEKIGNHKGIVNYTIGQRRKIGIGGKVSPLYVVNINAKKNTVTVGEQSDLKKSKIIIGEINWISELEKKIINCEAKIKSDHTPTFGKLTFIKDSIAEFEFNSPQISIAPGQACVFYSGDEVLGGGWIKKEIANLE